jgi:RNA polymerase sigma-70 factor, ECF subfamily
MAHGQAFHSTDPIRRPDPEAELVAQLCRGDETAFVTLIESYSAPMLRLASVHLARTVAEDVVQDTWMGVLQGIGRFEGRSTLKTWIFSILMNRVRTQVHREGRSVPFSALRDPTTGSDPAVDPSRFRGADDPKWPHWWAAPPKGWGDSPEDRLLSQEGLAQIRRAVEALPAGQREVITLCDLEGWDSAEVCDLLQITPTNQRVLLHRARSKVRSALEEYYGEA